MAQAKKLYTCEIDRGGPKIHPCRKAHDALDEAGHDYETVVFDKNKPMGLFTKGKRPGLKELSGQEKLPVLELTDGSTVAGSGKIVQWAKDNAPAA
jgi:glutathione S-transferase